MRKNFGFYLESAMLSISSNTLFRVFGVILTSMSNWPSVMHSSDRGVLDVVAFSGLHRRQALHVGPRGLWILATMQVDSRLGILVS